MKLTADTNLLIRAVTGDDPEQARRAPAELETAELIAIPLPALCEFVRVLAQGYKVPIPEIADAVRRLIDSANVAVNRPAAEAGIAMLAAGGDCADG